MDENVISLNDYIKNNPVFKHEVELIETKKKSSLDGVSSLNWGEDWLFEEPSEELAVLRSIYGKELVIPQGDVGLFVAAGGTGKTQLLMQLVAALGTDTKWLDLFVQGETKGRICYVFGEEHKKRTQRRFQKVFKSLNFSKEQRLKFIKNVILCPMHKLNATFSKEEDSFQKELTDFLNKNSNEDGWSLIILDPASRFLPKDAEIDNAAATAFIRECEKLSDLAGNPSILISHHVNKSSMGGAKMFTQESDSNQSASRGASGLVDGARFVINVDNILKEDWLLKTQYANKRLLKIIHSKINCGPFMQPVHGVIDTNGVIYSLSESEEEDLKIVKSSYNVIIKQNKSFCSV